MDKIQELIIHMGLESNHMFILAMTIPGNTGTGLLYVLYFGYLLMEIQSILENYQKIGIDVSLFQNFINRYSKSTMDNNKTNNSNEKEKKEEK